MGNQCSVAAGALQHVVHKAGGDSKTTATDPPTAEVVFSAEAESHLGSKTKRKKKGGTTESMTSSEVARMKRVSAKSKESPLQASHYNHLNDMVNQNFQLAAGERHRSANPLGVVGLRNLGNTCFMNSSLQCLSATIPLTDYFLGYNYRSEINAKNPLGSGGKLVNSFGSLIKAMWLGNSRTVKPQTFKIYLERFAPQFKGTHQHDAQEFLSFLLDGIHEDLNRIKSKPYIEDKDCDGRHDNRDAIECWKNYLKRDKSVIVDIFQGQLRSQLKCMTCGNKSIRFEPFMYLSLPISESCSSLQDCLDLYVEREYLKGKNKWFCSKCNKRRTTMKKTDLWILPPILIVHLKRFKFNERGVGSKNNSPINFPVENWDLSKLVQTHEGSLCYDLYGVANHHGTMGGGHYTATTLNRFDDHWYEFSDSNTSRSSSESLKSQRSSAYVLFYNRSDGEANKSSEGSFERGPLVRRQSESRPDLWPHMQVQRQSMRSFSRSSHHRRLSVESQEGPPRVPRRTISASIPEEILTDDEGLDDVSKVSH